MAERYLASDLAAVWSWLEKVSPGSGEGALEEILETRFGPVERYSESCGFLTFALIPHDIVGHSGELYRREDAVLDAAIKLFKMGLLTE